MNKATPIGQIPYIPQQQGSNDPRVVHEVMNDLQQYPQQQVQGYNNSSQKIEGLLSDVLVKESILVLVIYVLLNTEFVNNILMQYIPTFVQINEVHMQTVLLKGVGMGVITYLVKRFLF